MFKNQCNKRLQLYHKLKFTIFHNNNEIIKKSRKKKNEIKDFILNSDDE